jgi:MraZ protein
MQAMSEYGPITEDTNATPKGSRATFYGTAYHKISGRNQVAIPKHLKRAIDEAQEGQLLLMRMPAENFLRLYTKKQFDTKLDEIKGRQDLSADKKASVIDALARMAEPVEPDTQGRFVLPGKWTDALNLRDEVAFCGAFTYIKIWPAELQREQERKDAEKLADVSEQVTSILNM